MPIYWGKCKRRGCESERALGQVYCSADHAPLGHWRMWEEPVEYVDCQEPDHKPQPDRFPGFVYDSWLHSLDREE